MYSYNNIASTLSLCVFAVCDKITITVPLLWWDPGRVVMLQ